MLNKLQKRNSEGFTIIEVMIVLAIAALILLIVLLAVPALQRNSRNTQIRNDASTIAGGINTFVSDNDGKVPTSVTGTGTVTISDGTAADDETIKVGGSTAVTSPSTAPTDAIDTGTVQVVFGKTCAGGDSSRAVAIYYSTETSGDPKLNCVDS
jgi:prepilin-type N-terminal cleavage/methylation domain-containing protein